MAKEEEQVKVSSTTRDVILQMFYGGFLFSNNCLDYIANRNYSEQFVVL